MSIFRENNLWLDDFKPRQQFGLAAPLQARQCEDDGRDALSPTSANRCKSKAGLSSSVVQKENYFQLVKRRNLVPLQPSYDFSPAALGDVTGGEPGARSNQSSTR